MKLIVSSLVLASSVGCSAVSDSLNIYSDDVPNELGVRSSDALVGGSAGKKSEEARHALEAMGSYRQAQAPQPYYPVVRPAEIRLMWIPDHLNRLGDLVPAHYYYLRVTEDRFELQDAFDIEEQPYKRGTAGRGAGEGIETSTPWQYKDSK